MDGRRKEKRSAAAAAAHPPWVALDRVPRLVLTDKSQAGEAHDLTFEFEEPPRRSVCKLRRTLFAGVPELRITAVAHTGSFLVSAIEPKPENQHQAGATAATQERKNSFLFCDGTAGTARFLPIAPVALHRANVGLLANAAGRHVVAALHKTEGAADATIFFCEPDIDNAQAQAWDKIAVAYPPGGHRPWNTTTVVCHGTRIYWVDPALGILCYDPFADDSKLLYVPHPPGSHALATSQGSRHVQLSRGKIRCVLLEGAHEAAVIKIWTLSDASSAGQFHWKPGFEIPVSQLTEFELRSKITAEDPKILCMHPHRQTLIFLSLGQFIFEVDLMLGGTVVHRNTPMYAQESGIEVVRFSLMPWTVILAPARVLGATSQLRATLEGKGNGPGPSVLSFDLGMSKPYHVNYCYVSAVDSKSGSLLIFEEHERKARQKTKKTWTFHAYFILQSGDSIQKLPALPGMAEWHHNNAGITVQSSTGNTLVGLLNMSDGILNFWTSDSPKTWQKVSVSHSHIPSGFNWTGHGAHALDGSLYWLDLRMGFLTCNPFSDRRNELKFISLPKESLLLSEDLKFPLNMVRCVSVSSGSIRFFDIEMWRQFPFVKLWSYVNDAPGWTLEYTVDFSTMNNLSNTTFSPGKMLSPGFVHPWDLSRIYFLQGQKAFEIDAMGHIREESEFKVIKPPQKYRASLVHVCNVPIRSLNHLPAYPAPADV